YRDQQRSEALLNELTKIEALAAEARREHRQRNADNEHEQRGGRTDRLHDGERREQQGVSVTEGTAEIDQLVRGVDSDQRCAIGAQQLDELPPIPGDAEKSESEQGLAAKH